MDICYTYTSRSLYFYISHIGYNSIIATVLMIITQKKYVQVNHKTTFNWYYYYMCVMWKLTKFTIFEKQYILHIIQQLGFHVSYVLVYRIYGFILSYFSGCKNLSSISLSIGVYNIFGVLFSAYIFYLIKIHIHLKPLLIVRIKYSLFLCTFFVLFQQTMWTIIITGI